MLVLTDGHYAYAAVHPIDANSTRSPIRISLAYVRDSPMQLCLSFADDVFNLANVATNAHGDPGIYARIAGSGKFAIFRLWGNRPNDVAALQQLE